MSEFLPALNFLLDNEDAPRAYTEVVDSDGGKVIAGINSNSWPEQEAMIAALPVADRPQEVARFYLAHYWLPGRMGQINDQDTATRVMDFAVNRNEIDSVKALQEAVNEISGAGLAVDGILGRQTAAAANACDGGALLAAFKGQRCALYRLIALKNPKDQKYLDAWLARAMR